jgi:hypothetical protein
MAPQRVFKTLMGPYAVAWENRTGLLGMFTDRSHAVRTAVQREDFVRIVLARQIGYELNNRPEWTQIPLKGLLELFETER